MNRCRGGGSAAALALAVLLAGCASSPSAPAHQPAARSAPPAAARSAPPAASRALAARYLAIAEAGNRHLETEFGRLHGRDRHRLAAARADLRDIAATERRFDQRLLAIRFPAAIEAAARTLYRVNQVRASLTMAAARSLSLRQLRGYQPHLAAANVPVEQAVRSIRRMLYLPPPETS